MTYNLETLPAEKFETMIARGTANTSMRDFYDVFILTVQGDFDLRILRSAIMRTAQNRNSESQLKNHIQIMQEVAASSIMEKAWNGFKRQSLFVGDLSWEKVVEQNMILIEKILDC